MHTPCLLVFQHGCLYQPLHLPHITAALTWFVAERGRDGRTGDRWTWRSDGQREACGGGGKVQRWRLQSRRGPRTSCWPTRLSFLLPFGNLVTFFYSAAHSAWLPSTFLNFQRIVIMLFFFYFSMPDLMYLEKEINNKRKADSGAFGLISRREHILVILLPFYNRK